MGLVKEFREFAVKGNAVDMAVGLVIGASFSKIVTSLVNDVIMPPVGLLLGGTNFSELQIVLKRGVVDATTGAVLQPAVALRYGALVGTALDFLLVAFALFLVVKLINIARRTTGLAPKA
ncbi:MAG: large conductance mechanosensitive channel protein MscL [Planctomycetes bacterium]|nr:large conductance mechanosensitive channel protein MscL [Planctomycetota bacterium]